jgi:hypothetical protein
MTLAQVGEQRGRGDRVAAARRGADPELVGGIVEEEIHGGEARLGRGMMMPRRWFIDDENLDASEERNVSQSDVQSVGLVVGRYK